MHITHILHTICYIEIKNNKQLIVDTQMTAKIFILGIRSFTIVSIKNPTNNRNVRYDDVKQTASISFLLE